MSRRNRSDHEHYCAVCGIMSPWCCRHKWAIGYIAVVVTLLLVAHMMEVYGWLP